MLLLRTLLNSLLPMQCYLCQEPSPNLICRGCAEDFIDSKIYRCRQCGIGLISNEEQQVCGECLKNPPYFDQTVVATDYLPPVDQLVQKLKFGHQLLVADLMADRMRDAVIRHFQGELPDLLIPVPLSRLRLIERGFNQAHEIAKILAPQLGVTLASRLLNRIKETQAQSSLPLKQRHANTRNAFVCTLNSIASIRDRHIGVIDDVMTTGTTLNEIAKTLKRHGAHTVSNLVFARTPKQS